MTIRLNEVSLLNQDPDLVMMKYHEQILLAQFPSPKAYVWDFQFSSVIQSCLTLCDSMDYIKLFMAQANSKLGLSNLLEPEFSQKSPFAQLSLSKVQGNFLLNLSFLSVVLFLGIPQNSLERKTAVKLSLLLHREPDGRLWRCAKWSHLPGLGCSNLGQCIDLDLH